MSRVPIIVSNRYSFNKFRVLRATKNPCASMMSLIKPFVYRGLFAGWTATASETVSKAESHGTIRHYLSELAEALLSLAFTHAVETGLVTRFEQTSYEN